ncbi:MAG: hypothetical protein QM767_05875 [Anaeromyxobacter sp.]
MVAIFSGNSLGLNLSSLTSLGGRGLFGSSTQGQGGERAYVNVFSGNLVLQRGDALLVGNGPDTSALRTYNSQGAYDFDGNGDFWQGAPTRAIQDLGGGRLRRIDTDGSTCDYAWDAAKGAYLAEITGSSARDSIVINGDGTYTWTDGASTTRETYQAGAVGRILTQTDAAGNTLSYSYSGSNQLTAVTSASGESITYTYGGVSGRNLLRVDTALNVDGVLTLQSVSYTYDAQNRLETVSVALNPRGLGAVTAGGDRDGLQDHVHLRRDEQPRRKRGPERRHAHGLHLCPGGRHLQGGDRPGRRGQRHAVRVRCRGG